MISNLNLSQQKKTVILVAGAQLPHACLAWSEAYILQTQADTSLGIVICCGVKCRALTRCFYSPNNPKNEKENI